MTCAEVNSHLYQARLLWVVELVRGRDPLAAHAAGAARHGACQVKTLAEEIGVAFLGLGFQPKWSVADTPAMPKARTFLFAFAETRKCKPRLRRVQTLRRAATKSCGNTCQRSAAWG